MWYNISIFRLFTDFGYALITQWDESSKEVPKVFFVQYGKCIIILLSGTYPVRGPTTFYS